MAKIKFLPSDLLVETAEGESLLTAARKAGITDVECCGMNPLCGECKVSIIDGETVLTEARTKELEYCRKNGFLPYQRLGCLARICKDGEVWVELERHVNQRRDECQKADLES